MRLSRRVRAPAAGPEPTTIRHNTPYDAKCFLTLTLDEVVTSTSWES
ncbi:conserved hypothetical protein [Actinomyces sp. oral taxon 180 str. F0310]|nr:conserved hypothetical protein [Actinomyces sp. oral taxon 180 str. F0310]